MRKSWTHKRDPVVDTGRAPSNPPMTLEQLIERLPVSAEVPALPPPVDEPAGPDDADQAAGVVTLQAAADARALLLELAARKIEALRLYEPLPVQALFHSSTAMERLLRGSNRGGKTLPAACEVARAVTGQDPYDKYPDRDGRCVCIGKDGKHIGQVMWRKLSRPGAFRIIRDLATGAWRAFRPWQQTVGGLQGDADRLAETKPAPPLIPPRLVKAIAWENKKENQPNLVSLHNGWELTFYSSLGKPPNGIDVDLVWFDEEIVDGDWYPEMSARLLDRAGRFFWSATPQAGTEQLFNLHERCEEERERANAKAREFVILLEDNPHISEEQKREFIDKLVDPDERAVRVGGEFAITSYKVFPEFSMQVQGVPYQVLPDHWTRYAVVDPGRQVCAVLFAAVPPAVEGEYVYVYDELYLRACDAEVFGQRMGQKAVGQSFYAFLIDGHAGRQTQIAAGKTIEQQYSEALRKHKVKSLKTGHGFQWGSDDVEAGIGAVRSWLRIREDGTTKLRVVSGVVPNFEWEMKRYHYLRVRGVVTDKPDQRKNNHLIDGLRYLAMYNPRHHKSTGPKRAAEGAVAVFREKQRRKKAKNGPAYVRLG